MGTQEKAIFSKLKKVFVVWRKDLVSWDAFQGNVSSEKIQ